MSEVMEIEARIKDLISGELKNITKVMEDTARKGEDTSKRHQQSNSIVSKSVMDLKSSWNIAAIAASSFVGAMGAMTILNKVSALFRDATKAAIEQADAEALLASALHRTSRTLIDFASEQQKSTTFADEEILQAEAMIGAYIKEEDSIKQLTLAAMNLAVAKRMDLRSAADMLTKSIISGTNSLSRYGIHIKDTTDVSMRMKDAIDSVNRAFGGMADAMAKTDSGKMKQLKNIMDDQKEVLGKELLPLINEFYGILLNINSITFGPMSKALHAIAIELRFLKGESIESIKTTEYIAEAMKKEGQEGALYLFNRLTEVSQKYNELNIKRQAFLSGKSPWNVDQKAIADYERQLALIKETLALLTKPQQEQQKTQLITSNSEKDLQADLERKQKHDNDIDRQARRLFDDNMKRIEEEQEAIKKAEDEHINLMNMRATHSLNIEIKRMEQEKRNKEDTQRKDKEVTQQKLSNQEFVADSSFRIIRNLASVSKASSAVQKTIDIGQATANVALAVTKALATPGGKWQIPFIVALGATQIAMIAAAKYQGGGIVPGTGREDTVPSMLTPGEMVLNMGQQTELFKLLNRPSSVSNTANSFSSSANNQIAVNINVGSGGNYDLRAATMTVDSLVPLLGDALVKAQREGRLHQYQTAR